MIKFFRKIRQKLIVENRFSKYLLYAVGEIILVVIGILIAIKINSFVTNQNLQKDNKVFLTKMLNELKLNKKRMNYLAYKDVDENFISLETAIQNSDSLLKLSYKGFQKEDFPFLLNLRYDAGGSFLNLHTSTFDELLNTGKLYTLASDNLITKIKNYHKRIEREDLYNKVNTSNVKQGVDLITNNLQLMLMDYEYDKQNFSLSNYEWFFNKKSEKYRNLQIGIDLIKDGQTQNFIKMNQIIQYSDSLIIDIENELKIYD